MSIAGRLSRVFFVSSSCGFSTRVLHGSPLELLEWIYICVRVDASYRLMNLSYVGVHSFKVGS